MSAVEGAHLGTAISVPVALMLALPLAVAHVLAAGAAAGRRVVAVGAGTLLRPD
jgi:hypothetical protein